MFWWWYTCFCLPGLFFSPLKERAQNGTANSNLTPLSLCQDLVDSLSLCFKTKLAWLVTEMACDLNGYTYSQILSLLSSTYPKICSRKWKAAESLHTLCTLLGTYKKQSCNPPRNGWSSQSAMKIQQSACPSTSQSADAATEQPKKKKKKVHCLHCHSWMKCSVMRHYIVLQVANVVRQSCLLHCTYHWVSWHFILPVGFFRWVYGTCKLSWIVMRSRIRFYISRGVPQQSVFPKRYHFDEGIVFTVVMWHWFVAIFKSKLNNSSSWHYILLFFFLFLF